MVKGLTVLVLVVFNFLNVGFSYEISPNLNYDPPETKYYMQTLDHFNPVITTKFKQRYLISIQYWDRNNGPIFFYTGNEGDIQTFADNTGFMWDIAPKFNAMVVFAEHRYYGKSQPYPGVDPTPENKEKFGQFTADQALADYAELINHLKSTTPGAPNSSVIAFGGSYGGMLAAWFRIKFPNIVDGSIAASAPVAMFEPLTGCEEFDKAVTESFAASPDGSQCVETIKGSYNALKNTAKSISGLDYISTSFNLCLPLKNISEIIALQNWMEGGWGNVAMGNYPYPTSFLNPMPAWPVNAICKRLKNKPENATELIAMLANAVQIFFNFTGDVKCLDLSAEIVPEISSSMWYLQTCNQFPMPFCSDGANDMFRPSSWSFETFSQNCKDQFGVSPPEKWAIIDFGGRNVKAASNIVFSNGDLDPWRVGGIFKSYYADSLIALTIDKGAHHLDLRHANPADPDSVIKARKIEVMEIAKWISEK